MKSSMALVAVLTCVVAPSLWSADTASHQERVAISLSEQGTASLSLEVTRGTSIQVNIKATSSTECLSEHLAAWTAPLVWLGWGADTSPPVRLTNSLEVTVNGIPAILSMSAYADLANPHSIALEAAPNGFTLTILGGESSTAYTAELRFRDKYLISRRVEHRTMGLTAWESTIYSYTTVGVNGK